MPDSAPLSSVTMVTDPATAGHDPGAEIWIGVTTPGTEVLGRVTAIEEVLLALGATSRGPDDHGDAVLGRIHSRELVEYLRTAHDHWRAGPYQELVGQDRVVPYVFPTAGMLGAMPARTPVARHALAGQFCYDTMTLISAGTWQAARTSIALAQTAADLALEGHAAYALCRPPGHHAATAAFGGSCYLNNAAAAAEQMRAQGLDKVAILDMDAHHGNGTQEIFYQRGDVFYGSVHVDPGAGWFPHFVGYADETGTGAGRAANRNRPLPEGSGDQAFLSALTALVEEAEQFGAQGLVVSLGVDTAAGDPESPLRVTPEGLRAAGSLMRELGVPTAFVQEGGYVLETLGGLVAEVLRGYALR